MIAVTMMAKGESTVTTKGEGVILLPCSSARRAVLVVSVTLSAQSSVLLSLRCKSPELTVFVNRVADPVDPRVITHSVVCRVNQDDLVVLVRRILNQYMEVNIYTHTDKPSNAHERE